MSERVERLRREIEAERAAVMAEHGLHFDCPIVVRGGEKPDEVIQRRLERVPAGLKDDARLRMARHLVMLPWLTSRKVAAA